MASDGAQETNGCPASGGASRFRRRTWWAVAAAVGLAAVVAAAAGVWRRPRPEPVPEIAADADDDLEAPARPDPGYVGAEACAACHAARVAEFRATGHFRACRLPRPGDMPPGFAPGRGKFATRDPSLRIEMAQSGDDFLQTAVRATPAGERRTTARIDLVYGAGTQADEVFHTWHDDGLYELPMAWLHPLNCWAMSSYNPYGDTADLSRATTPRCLECHNTWFEYVPGTRSQYRRDNFHLGVTCERCHGPGREHVAFHRDHPDEKAGHAIVHPGLLSRERQLDLCSQCHSNAIKHRRPPFSYRPGEPLEDYFRTNFSKHPENDHVANQVKYLRQSKCFQKDDRLTCTTCHNPHRRSDPAAVGRACLKCHPPADCGERGRLPAAVRDDCAGCHMPPRVWMNVHFHTEDDQYVPPIRRHDHRIAVHPDARQAVLLAWHRKQPGPESRLQAERLQAALVKHWLAEAAKREGEYRFLAAIGAYREALRLDTAPAIRDKLRQAVATQARLDADLVAALHQMEQRRYAEAAETLRRALRVKPDWAVAHGKLGTLYAIAGQRDRAAEHLRAVARYDPDDPYGYSMLGWLAYLGDRPEEAVEAYRKADEIEPYDAKINYHMGLALMKLARWPEAAACFRKAAAIDPNHAGAYQGLGTALGRQGRTDEAVRCARRAARLTRFQNPDVLITLAEAYAGAGRTADADRTASQALDAARAGNPELVPQIRQRLREVQSPGKRAAE